MKKHLLTGALFFLWGGITLFAGENLLLVHANENGVPENSQLPQGTEVSVIAGKLNARLQPGVSIVYRIYMTPEMRLLHLTGKFKTTNLKPGKEGWQNGRMSLRFLGKDGKMVGEWPQNYDLSGTNEVTCDRVYLVPNGAVELLAEPANFGTAGTAEFIGLELGTAPKNLLLAPNASGLPIQGIKKGTVTATRDNSTATITIDGTGQQGFYIPVQPSWKALKLTFDMKMENVQHGDADWKDARIAMRFNDKNGKGTGPWPENIHGGGSSDWQSYERIYEIPKEAAWLSFEPANYGTSGKVEFRNLRLEVQE